MSRFFFIFAPQEPSYTFVDAHFYLPLPPPHFFSFYFILGLVSPLEFPFPSWYSFECISRRALLFDVTHSGEIPCICETELSTHTIATTSKCSKLRWSQVSPDWMIRHFSTGPRTRTVSVPHKQPCLELSCRHVLCACQGSYRPCFQYVDTHALRVQIIMLKNRKKMIVKATCALPSL